MDKGKIYRIIRGNGLKPENFKSIDTNGDIYVIENDVEYKLTGFNKFVVDMTKLPNEESAKESIKKLMTEYKEDIVIHTSVEKNNNKTYEWTPPAGKTTGMIKTEEEIERIKAIKKPRGWHFKDNFIDSEGNVYKKGVLQ